MALQSQARVPAMLNYSAGAEAMLAACAAAQVRCVVSSRAFVEKGKLEAAVARMEGAVRFVWLEDVRAGIGRGDKLRGWLAARRARRLPGARVRAGEAAVVLFTSGSEGRAEGRGAEPPQHRGQHRPGSRRGGLQPPRTGCSTRCRCSTPSG